MSIVELEPMLQLCASRATVLPCATVGPFPQHALNESLGFAVGLRGARLGPEMSHSQRLASLPEVVCAIARSIVGEYAADNDPLRGKPGACSAQECDASGAALIGQDLSESDAGVVVDRDVDEFVSRSAGLAGARAGDSMPRPPEASQSLDVDMEQIARSAALIAAHWPYRFQRPVSADAVPCRASRTASSHKSWRMIWSD